MEEVGSFYRAIPVTDPPQFLQSNCRSGLIPRFHDSLPSDRGINPLLQLGNDFASAFNRS